MEREGAEEKLTPGKSLRGRGGKINVGPQQLNLVGNKESQQQTTAETRRGRLK